ncbi:AraC family transcriptional regulator [Paenibacillus sp. 1011MAR3C5]|uniref:helix-turn-helix transcriptional regulator n=1 Tax=Paenibacillus sp. 1011MAR3C5 TaxID=1675787 RepID=UPI000E6CD34F|nr:AraC family transcriptional regulator [Paenibacillus sp. 1011MAR3C5]RJE88385.1 AraC family transcriptional regulator [Paenibacillus sp. 1011MAR3C5]
MDTFRDIIAERRTYTANKHTHSHGYGQLIIPLQGELEITAGPKSLMMNTDTLLYVPPACEHTYHSAVRNEFLVLDIPHFMLSSIELGDRGIACPVNNQWKGIRYLILSELDRQSEHGPALKELFPYISHCLVQEQKPRSIQYIHEHYDEPLTVQKLAEMEHYNRSYYSDWFLKETGKTPSAYIQEVRLSKAKELLRDTNLSILNIAVQVGLEHQSSLTRLFQQYERVTPSQFRKMNPARLS